MLWRLRFSVARRGALYGSPRPFMAPLENSEALPERNALLCYNLRAFVLRTPACGRNVPSSSPRTRSGKSTGFIVKFIASGLDCAPALSCSNFCQVASYKRPTFETILNTVGFAVAQRCTYLFSDDRCCSSDWSCLHLLREHRNSVVLSGFVSHKNRDACCPAVSCSIE